MATKKKPTKAAAPKKTRPLARLKNAIKKAEKKSTRRIQSPRSQVLPGMEQITNRTLNRLCEELSDSQREMNVLIADVDDLHRQAQETMERDNVMKYIFSGVQLSLRKGTTKLSVKMLKNKTEKAPNAKPDTASGQDAGEIADALTPDEERLEEQGDAS